MLNEISINSKHVKQTWTLVPLICSFFLFEISQILVFLFPAGLYLCFAKLTDANIFIILYGVTSIYFAGVMVRLMLVLAPVMCVISGITVSHLLSKYIKSPATVPSTTATTLSTNKDFKKSKKFEHQSGVKKEVAWAFVGMMTFLLITYTFHCTWVTSEAYSSPSIVLSARSMDGSRIIFDDFREAYYWLKMVILFTLIYWLLLATYTVMLFEFLEYTGRCTNYVLVGLWISNYGHGKSYHFSG